MLGPETVLNVFGQECEALRKLSAFWHANIFWRWKYFNIENFINADFMEKLSRIIRYLGGSGNHIEWKHSNQLFCSQGRGDVFLRYKHTRKNLRHTHTCRYLFTMNWNSTYNRKSCVLIYSNLINFSVILFSFAFILDNENLRACELEWWRRTNPISETTLNLFFCYFSSMSGH